jgi:hypothetical protein
VLVIAIVVAVGSIWVGNRILPVAQHGKELNPTISAFLTVVGFVYGARAAITRMYRIIGSQQPNVASRPITQHFLDQLSTLASARNERITGTKPRIPGLLWIGLIFGAVVVVGLTGFLRVGSTTVHVLVSSTIAILLGLLLCIALSLDREFTTDQRVTAGPFNHALEIFDSVDNDTRYFQR